MTQIRQVLPDSEGTVPDQEKEAAAVGGNVTPKWHRPFPLSHSPLYTIMPSKEKKSNDN